jgi:hypothetical protein
MSKIGPYLQLFGDFGIKVKNWLLPMPTQSTPTDQSKEPLNKPSLRSGISSGAKDHIDFAAFAARLKSCPVTKQPYAEVP